MLQTITLSNPIAWFSLTFILIAVYWTTSRIHYNICAPSGLKGFLYTALSMSSPICQATVSILNFTSYIYISIWTSLIATLFSTLSYISSYFKQPYCNHPKHAKIQ